MPFSAMGITNARLNAAELQIRQNGEWAVRRDAESCFLYNNKLCVSASLRTKICIYR